jgi:hypothetical protein
MYAMSAAVQVNPPGVEPVLSREQVWRGLVMKAENALPFVPSMQACNVVSRTENGLLREIMLGGNRFREQITFTPEVEVVFERVGTTSNAGWITNVISESDHGLLLTFTFGLVFPDVEPGSAAEKQRGDSLKSDYLGAIGATLRTVRKLLTEGKL